MLKQQMRSRGWLKVVLLTISVDQLMTVIFSFAMHMLVSDVTQLETLIFSCVTCMLVSGWLVSDARAAWDKAKKEGHVGTAMDPVKGESVVIAARCPRRWLVTLHLELNPELAAID